MNVLTNGIYKTFSIHFNNLVSTKVLCLKIYQFLQFVQNDHGSTPCDGDQLQCKIHLRNRNRFKQSSLAPKQKGCDYEELTDGVHWRHQFGESRTDICSYEENFYHNQFLFTIICIGDFKFFLESHLEHLLYLNECFNYSQIQDHHDWNQVWTSWSYCHIGL